MVEVDNIIRLPACEALPLAAKPAPILTGFDYERIETLRALVQRSRLAARCDVDKACATIAIDRCFSLRMFASAFFGLLDQFAVRRMSFYPPGASEFSDDEIWLSRVLRSVQHREVAQTRALIAWRIRPMGHRRALFLASGLANAFADSAQPDDPQQSETAL